MDEDPIWIYPEYIKQIPKKKQFGWNDFMKEKEPRFHGEVSEQRSRNMSRIRGKDTSIELKLRKSLWAKGYRYINNYKRLPGAPDIVMTKYKIAIFCYSEFFHGKDWDMLKVKLEKGSNPGYWVKKIERNIQRDADNDKKLKFAGWTVIHFWGKEIMSDTDECVRVIEEAIFDIDMAEHEIGGDYEEYYRL